MKSRACGRRGLIYTLAGASTGYVILHPYTMLVYGVTERHGFYMASGLLGQVVRHLQDVLAAFEPGMLYMGIPYAMLGGVGGLFFGYWREAERQREEMEKGALAAEALVSAIDAKSPWTKGHSENVAEYAARTADAMGLTREDIGNLRLAALLHDIGKIGTYDTILDKHGELTEEEFAIVKKHPEAGVKILGPIKQLKDIIPVISHHHERWDGKGYPDGLKGEEIPLLAHIICVADAYDAMIADRPYKPSMGGEYATGELKRWSGVKYAPRVVEAFLKTLDTKAGRQ